MKKNNQLRLFGLLLVTVILWRVTLGEISYLAQLLPYRPSFPYADNVLPRFGNRTITTWAQFDGVHYLTIATKGYAGADLIQAFFPLYPFLLRFLGFISWNLVMVGTIFSTLCFSVGIWWFYLLLRLDETEEVTNRAVGLLLLAPTAFFFTTLYTESLFFMLLIGCFYFARIKQWWVAGLLGILLTSTRIVGVFIIPALMYEYWFSQGQRKILQGFSALVPLLGIGSYMLYLKQTFNDPLLFYHVQGSFGASRESKKLVILFQVFYRYIKMFMTIPFQSRLFFTVSQEFFAGLIGLVCLGIGFFITRPSYIIFSLLAYLAPTLTGSFLSMPRFLLVLFPIYLVAAKVLPRWGYWITLGVSSLLLTINLIIFTQGLWVA